MGTDELTKRMCPVCGSWMIVNRELYGNRYVSGLYNCEVCGPLNISSKITREPVTVMPACPVHGFGPVMAIGSCLVVDGSAEYRCTKCEMQISRDPESRRFRFFTIEGEEVRHG